MQLFYGYIFFLERHRRRSFKRAFQLFFFTLKAPEKGVWSLTTEQQIPFGLLSVAAAQSADADGRCLAVLFLALTIYASAKASSNTGSLLLRHDPNSLAQIHPHELKTKPFLGQ